MQSPQKSTVQHRDEEKKVASSSIILGSHDHVRMVRTWTNTGEAAAYGVLLI
jgi:hypothetical protein